MQSMISLGITALSMPLSMVTNSLTDVSTRVRGLTAGLAGLRIAEQGSFEVIT